MDIHVYEYTIMYVLSISVIKDFSFFILVCLSIIMIILMKHVEYINLHCTRR